MRMLMDTRGWERRKKWSEERKEGIVRETFPFITVTVLFNSINRCEEVESWFIQGLLRITVQSLRSFGGNRRLLFPNKARITSRSNRCRRLWLNCWSTVIKLALISNQNSYLKIFFHFLEWLHGQNFSQTRSKGFPSGFITKQINDVVIEAWSNRFRLFRDRKTFTWLAIY